VAGYYSATRQQNAAAPLADFCTAAYTKRVVLSDRKVGWNVDEVEQWREARNRERFRRASAKESSASSAGET
jgi:hypothetical protein